MSWKTSPLLQGYKKKVKQPLDDIMTESDLAEIFDCTVDTLYLYRKDLGLPYIKVGRDIYYSQKSVYNWLLSLEVNNNGSLKKNIK